MHGLSIYEIKRICHRAYFSIVLHGNVQRLTNFSLVERITLVLNIVKILVIFSQLLSFKLKLLPMTSNLLETVHVFLLSQALTRYYVIYFGNSSKFHGLL